MIILGVDPGSRITGFGVINAEQGQYHYVTSGCIRMSQVYTPGRLKQIFDGLSEVIESTRPDRAAIEQIFMFQNPGAAIKLGQARGTAMLTLAHYDLVVAEYSARQIKKSVAGTGAATKYQVQHMVQSLLGLSARPQSDAADALAMAVCHYNSAHGLTQASGASKTVRGRLRR